MNSVQVTHESGKLRQEILIGRHHLISDEPIELGGEDAGPAPLDYLASALGTCTAITLHMYAQRKSWPLKNAEVTVSLEKRDEIARFVRTFKLTGELSDEQKARLLAIANQCPVHKILSGKIEIETALA